VPCGQPPEIAWDEAADVPTIVDRDDKPEQRLNPVRKPTVFISYAWKVCDEDIAQLHKELESWGWDVRRDKTEMTTGDSIKRFMANATGSDRIVIVLGEKYLKSPFCISELHQVYLRSGSDEDAFRGRIVPITLPDAKIFSMKDRGNIARHWKSEHDEAKSLASDNLLAATDLVQWSLMAKWALDVPNILAFIADTLHPVGFQDAKANNWAMLSEMLKRGTP